VPNLPAFLRAPIRFTRKEPGTVTDPSARRGNEAAGGFLMLVVLLSGAYFGYRSGLS